MPVFTGFCRLHSHFVFSRKVIEKTQGFNCCFQVGVSAGEVPEKTQGLGNFLRRSGKNKELTEIAQSLRKKQRVSVFSGESLAETQRLCFFGSGGVFNTNQAAAELLSAI